MQVPAQFEYRRATSVEHAIALLTRHGPESRVVAGGHSLIPMMKLRLAQPEMLIDINDLTDLARIRVDAAGLRLGALLRHADLLASAQVGALFPMLHDAERVIADPVVRNRGTVGGSVCQADPSEDLAGAFCALRAVAVVQAGVGEDGDTVRSVQMREFFTGPYQTAVGPAELLVELRIPLWCCPEPGGRAALRPGGGSAYVKVDRRSGDWAVAAAAAAVRLEPDGTVAEVGLGLTAVGARNFVAEEAEDFLWGRPLTAETVAEAGRIAARHCNPAADQRGPADYKRHLAGELTGRALRLAAARAGCVVPRGAGIVPRRAGVPRGAGGD